MKDHESTDLASAQYLAAEQEPYWPEEPTRAELEPEPECPPEPEE